MSGKRDFSLSVKSKVVPCSQLPCSQQWTGKECVVSDRRFLSSCMHSNKGRWYYVLEMGSLLLNSIGNPAVIPKPLIWIESDNMFGFDELFFLRFLSQSLNQSQRKESKWKRVTQISSYAFDNTAQIRGWRCPMRLCNNDLPFYLNCHANWKRFFSNIKVYSS